METKTAYLTIRQFQEQIIHWSARTIKRRIQNEGLPALKDSTGNYLFVRKEVELWLKRRTEKAG